MLAVTVALAVHRGLPWRKVVPYATAQTVGAFAGVALVYLTYREAFTAFDGGDRQRRCAIPARRWPLPAGSSSRPGTDHERRMGSWHRPESPGRVGM